MTQRGEPAFPVDSEPVPLTSPRAPALPRTEELWSNAAVAFLPKALMNLIAGQSEFAVAYGAHKKHGGVFLTVPFALWWLPVTVPTFARLL